MSVKPVEIEFAGNEENILHIVFAGQPNARRVTADKPHGGFKEANTCLACTQATIPTK